jgi:hypothetical protein
MSVQLVFKDGTSYTFSTADHFEPYAPDADFAAVCAVPHLIIGVVPFASLEYAIIS